MNRLPGQKGKTMERTRINLEIKTAILNMLIAIEYTHTYAFIIRDNGLVKACIVENADDVLPLVTICERNSKSHGGVFGIRMWNSNTAFSIIKEYARETITMCSVSDFENGYKEAKENGYFGNRGNYAEDMFALITNGTQNDSKNAKCTECGDVIVNGEHIQVKLWNATVTTETTINNLYKANKTA